MSKKTATKTTKPAGTPRAPRASAPKPEAGSAKAKSYYYVVYVDTYLNDSEILVRGVYESSKKIERLEASRPQYVRSFEDSIPENIVHEVAKTLKISITDVKGNYRKVDEILAELVQVI